MPTYSFRAVDAAGARQQGVEQATSAGALSHNLSERGLLVLDVSEAEPAREKRSGGYRRRREVLELTRALASLLPVGMPLSQALQAAMGVTTGSVHGTLTEVRRQVERGETLAQAMQGFPEYFSPMYVGVVRAGERSSDLDSAFARLATQLEREEKLRGVVLSAAIYPILLALVGTVAVVVLLFFVLPQFADLLEGSGATLPTSTRIVLAVGQTLRTMWWFVLVLPLLLLATLAWMRESTVGRRVASQILLRLPVIGGLRRQALASRFARLVGVLIGGGAPLLPALDDTIASLDDPIAREQVLIIRSRVREGSTLRAAVADSPIFPPLLAQLIGVGEDSGRLREFLLKAADIFQERTEHTTQRAAILAEPIMIVIFGAIVAVIALSLLQTIYGINTSSLQ